MWNTRQQQKLRPSDRDAFTVLEILVVMSIIVMVASMAAPQLMSMIRESTVFEAADQVREAAAEARRFSIDTGIDYELRYEVGGATVVILPSELELNVDESQNTSNTTEKYMRLLVELPEEIRLRAPDGVEEVSESLDAVRFGDLSGDMLTQKSWSAPILFRFDGTADNFTLRVSDKDGLTSNISIRGLTGSIRVSQVFQEDD
jgi:prepilin-type N-terminal cleavage/methylation domain-containing protein